jgi:hypothetical protein
MKNQTVKIKGRKYQKEIKNSRLIVDCDRRRRIGEIEFKGETLIVEYFQQVGFWMIAG